MFLFRGIIFFALLFLVVFSFYHEHYNAVIFEVVTFILIWLRSHYPDNKALQILFTKLAPVPEEGMLYSQYISQLILFNAKYIFILWTILTAIHYWKPDIFINLSTSSLNIIAMLMTSLFVFMFLLLILLIVNFLKYMYIKFFNRDSVYQK